MSFFDSKEEVISIELTQYGKDLFSKGAFDPKYYSFYDDDIIYDHSYYNVTENNTDIETRILEESIYLKPVYNLSDREKKYKSKDNIKDFFYESSKPVGTVNSVFNYIPSWNLKILEGTSIKETYYDSSYPNILQIDLQPCKITIDGDNLENIDINYDNILLELEEKNVNNIKDNFEIEFFEVTDIKDENNKNILNKLLFKKENIYIENEYLLDKPILFNELAETDPRYSEYFCEINSDKNVSSNNLNVIKKKQNKI